VIKKIENLIFLATIFLLPTQISKHFWPDFSFVSGIRVDYLSPTLYITDILLAILFFMSLFRITLRSRNKRLGVIKIVHGSRFKAQSCSLKFKILNYKLNFSFLTFNFELNMIQISYLLILLFALILGTIFSKQTLAAFYGLLKILEFSFFGFYIAFYFKTKNIKNFITTLGLSAVLFSSIGIIQFIKQSSIGGVLYYLGERTFSASTPGIANMNINGELVLRPYSTFPHPNVLAFFLLFVNSLIFFQLGQEKNIKRKIFFIFVLLISTIALFLTFSRIAIFLYLILLIYFFIQNIKALGKKMIVMLILGLFLFSLYLNFYYYRFFDSRFLLKDLIARRDLIDISFEIFKKYPLFGTGLNNFFFYESFYQKNITPVLLQPVHNIFILVLIESGIIVFVLFCLFIYKTFIRAYSGFKKERNKGLINFYAAVLFIFICMIINSLFDHFFLTVQQGQLILSVIVGLSYTKLRSS